MERKNFNLGFYIFFIGIIVILVLSGSWGWYLYFHSKGDLQPAVEKLRNAELTIQRMQDGFSRSFEISRISGAAYRTIQGALKKSRGLNGKLFEDIRKRDKELNRINTRGREDIERCIRLFDEFGRGFDQLYQDYRAIGKEPDS